MAKRPINLSAMTPAQAAKVVSSVVGKTVITKTIKADLKAGAPSNPDGTMHLVHYAAWLHQQIRNGQT